MIIALDAMGGDFAPEQTVRGALEATQVLDADIALVGREDQLQRLLGDQWPRDRITIHPATEVVEMTDSPRVALRAKADSSMARTVQMVQAGQAQACVSAGNSGAYMALCHTQLKTVPGIDRPAIALLLPTSTGVRVVLDVGANSDCKPDYLLQFGIMGSVYAQYALGIQEPRVGLLSIGTEAHKGSELTRAGRQLFESAPLNFVGNVEGDALFGDGQLDVVVCDGFVGNVLLKVVEGAVKFVLTVMRDSMDDNWKAKLGGLLMKDVFKQLQHKFDYGTYGGALLLGVNGICVVGHGKSDANAIKNALVVAERAANGAVVQHLQEACQQALPDSVVPV